MSEDRGVFFSRLTKLLRKRSIMNAFRIPFAGNAPCDLFVLYNEVIKQGGYENVSEGRNWSFVAKDAIELQTITYRDGIRAQKIYEKWLFPLQMEEYPEMEDNYARSEVDKKIEVEKKYEVKRPKKQFVSVNEEQEKKKATPREVKQQQEEVKEEQPPVKRNKRKPQQPERHIFHNTVSSIDLLTNISLTSYLVRQSNQNIAKLCSEVCKQIQSKSSPTEDIDLNKKL